MERKEIAPIDLGSLSLQILRKWAHSHMAIYSPDFVIGPLDNPQMQRWHIVPRNPFSNVYLHRFLRSDDNDAPHDHPWDSWSLLLEGEYIEETFPSRQPVTELIQVQASGNMRYRTAFSQHRIFLPKPEPVLTLFFTGPVVREWGFYTADGWVPWQDYVEATPRGNSRRGS